MPWLYTLSLHIEQDLLTGRFYSDTTAATLTNLFFHIAREPRLQKELQAELDALPDLSQEKLVGLKLLEALVNETLRLHPPVPSGTQRMTPPEGIFIEDQYIPGDVMVCIPTHTMFRGKTSPFYAELRVLSFLLTLLDDRVFERPQEFLPERWTTQPELVKDPSAFIPFNGGMSSQHHCPSKPFVWFNVFAF